MCEEFKKDFVKKIGHILEKDMIHCLENNYGILIKPCTFKNQVPECKQFFVKDGETTKGVTCKTCGCFVCEYCKSVKTMVTVECVNCYIKNAKLQQLCCKKCKSKRVYYYGATDWIYCKGCNSFSQLHWE